MEPFAGHSLWYAQRIHGSKDQKANGARFCWNCGALLCFMVLFSWNAESLRTWLAPRSLTSVWKANCSKIEKFDKDSNS